MSVYSWGCNTSKEVNETTSRAILDPYGPLPTLGHLRIVKVSSGHGYTLALDCNGSVVGWGAPTALGLGISRRTPTCEPARVVLGGLGAIRVVDIVAADGSSAAITADGALYEWGFLHAAQDGNGQQPSMAMVGMANREEARMSDRLKQLLRASTVAYLTGKTQLVRDNSPATDQEEQQEEEQFHELDQETIDAEAGILAVRTRRKMVTIPTRAQIPYPVAQVALGYGHTLILTRDGRVWGKGYNDRGQLGSGNRINTYMFQCINMPHPVMHIAAGNSHNVIIDDQGCAFSFGSNVLGQCGVGSEFSDRLVPTLIASHWFMGSRPKTVSCGSHHSVILTEDGYAYTFGHSEYGQHGSGGGMISGDLSHLARHWFVPRPLAPFCHGSGGDVQLLDVSCGTHFSMALDRQHQIWTWGYGQFGVLGHGPKMRGIHPQIVEALRGGGAKPLCISAGHKHACVLMEPVGDPFAMTLVPLYRAIATPATMANKNDLIPVESIGEQGLHAHHFILQARCPALLSHTVPKHVESRVVAALLEYLYTDRCESCPPHRFLDLAKLAQQFNLPRLEQLVRVRQAQKKASWFQEETTDDVVVVPSVSVSSTFGKDMLGLFFAVNQGNSNNNNAGGVITFKCVINTLDNHSDFVLPPGHTKFSWFNHGENGHHLSGHTPFSLGPTSPFVRCHRDLLARYPFFHIMLGDDFAEGYSIKMGKEIIIREIAPQVLKEVLLWCYVGDESRMRDVTVCDVVEAATRFGMEDLAMCCESYLCTMVQRVDMAHVRGLYEFAVRMGVLNKLKRVARAVLYGNVTVVECGGGGGDDDDDDDAGGGAYGMEFWAGGG